MSDVIEKVFISFFYYLSYRGFVSRVQSLPTATTQKTKLLPVWCSGEAPPGARVIGKFCDDHCMVDQLQLGIVHPAASQYTYGMHNLSTGVNYSTHVLADRQFICDRDTKYGVATRLISGMHGGGLNCRLRRGAETISSTDLTRLRCKLLWPAHVPMWSTSAKREWELQAGIITYVSSAYLHTRFPAVVVVRSQEVTTIIVTVDVLLTFARY